MAKLDSIAESDVHGPSTAEKQMAERGSPVGYSLSVRNTDSSAPINLIAQDPEVVDGVTVRFEGDSNFALESQGSTLIIPMTYEGNETALEEIKKEYRGFTKFCTRPLFRLAQRRGERLRAMAGRKRN
eukprot:gb/GECG01006568.1/.p1 GENE.gb/GECG01006568.1/~~gb/GECG01006568.1/.p1  ORF type:complete len:128 (+),score=12.91 gb/GECG01006568.1/:1-384(+)